MPSKGSPRITLRIPEPWYSRILETIARNNLTRHEEEWTMVSWIVDACKDKVVHQERARLQREKRKALRAGKGRKLCELMNKTETGGTLSSGSENSLPQDALFKVIWQGLSEDGLCDAVGTMEYTRVLKEWHAARRPAPIVDFIRRRANVSAEQV